MARIVVDTPQCHDTFWQHLILHTNCNDTFWLQLVLHPHCHDTFWLQLTLHTDCHDTFWLLLILHADGHDTFCLPLIRHTNCHKLRQTLRPADDPWKFITIWTHRQQPLHLFTALSWDLKPMAETSQNGQSSRAVCCLMLWNTWACDGTCHYTESGNRTCDGTCHHRESGNRTCDGTCHHT